jgi:formylglycine-generating enzyme required for sulfatase activity
MSNARKVDLLESAISAVERVDDNVPFSKLVEIACRHGAFDKARHLRYADWAGVDFAGSNLDGCDFTGALLIGCNFEDARIKGARFDGARIDIIRPYAKIDSKRTNLRAAKDWDAYAKGWKRAAEPPPDDHLPVGAIFQDAPFAPEMVVVPSGEFWMGPPDGSGGDRGDVEEVDRAKSEGPRHRVTIAQPFAIGRFAVTFEEWDWAQAHPEWRKRSGLKPRQPDDRKWGRGRHPVINVSWTNAQGYCRWLTAVTGKPYRLLSEAEWEYCCRAGTDTPFWWGASISTVRANYDGNYTYGGGPKGEYRERTVQVDSFEANPWGLYQMHGNVWEWCEDVWHPDYKEAPDDGSPWRQGGDQSLRVLRGGSWDIYPRVCRSALRNGIRPSSRVYDSGFRLARTLTSCLFTP